MSNPIRQTPLGVRFLHVIMVATFVFACDSSEKDSRPAPHANVLLVVIDSLRADHLKSYGYARETSPSLDRLAREGARFEDALTPTSWALPSLVTLLSSLPPEQHGVVRADLALRDDALTLTEVLKEAGFTTAAIVAGRDSEPGRGLSQGFESYLHLKEDPGEAGRAGSEAVSWLADWDRDGRVSPFFLFVQLPLAGIDDAPLRVATATRGANGPDVAQLGRAISAYDRGIGLADAQLDVLLQKLDQLELNQETVVIVTASHGEELLERGNMGHGNTLHRESVRVPLIVRFPRLVDAGKIVNQPARLMDIGTTIMMLARVREPAKFGFHFSARGLNRDLTEFLVGEWNGKHVMIGGDLSGKSQSIQQRGYKLIQSRDDRVEFFDLKLDPEEKHDLSESNARLTAIYLKKLKQWRLGCSERQQFARAYRASEPDLD